MTGHNSIKLFRFNQKCSQTLGIYVSQSNSNRYTVNAKNVTFVISLTQFAIALAAFIVYDATSMGEYGVIFFELIGVIQAMVAYFNTLWELDSISQFTKTCEQFIEKSELAVAYEDLVFFFLQLR